jgi:hypothetical protein
MVVLSAEGEQRLPTLVANLDINHQISKEFRGLLLPYIIVRDYDHTG